MTRQVDVGDGGGPVDVAPHGSITDAPSALTGATDDEVMRVHRLECAFNGHRYLEIEEFGYDGPVGIVCAHCDASWTVERKP